MTNDGAFLLSRKTTQGFKRSKYSMRKTMTQYLNSTRRRRRRLLPIMLTKLLLKPISFVVVIELPARLDWVPSKLRWEWDPFGWLVSADPLAYDRPREEKVTRNTTNSPRTSLSHFTEIPKGRYRVGAGRPL